MTNLPVLPVLQLLPLLPLLQRLPLLTLLPVLTLLPLTLALPVFPMETLMTHHWTCHTLLGMLAPPCRLLDLPNLTPHSHSLP